MRSDLKTCPKCEESFTSEKRRRKHQQETHGNIARGARPLGETRMTEEQRAARKKALVRESRRRAHESKARRAEVAATSVGAIEYELDVSTLLRTHHSPVA